MSIDGTDPYKRFGIYDGRVIDVDDPLQLRRVRCDVPGVCSDTGWARPKTAGGGGAQRGGHVMPVVGDTVYVQFIGGDTRLPIYECGAWGRTDEGPEMPTDILAAGADGPLVSSLEFTRGSVAVRITVDERSGQRSFRAVAVQKNGDAETVLGSIELDIEKRVLDLYALAGVQLRSKGFVDISAVTSRILKRRVRRSSSPI